MEKWQEQVEAILKEHYQDDEEKLKKANELVGLTLEVEPPHGDIGPFVAQVLKVASEELEPLTATYTGFRLGVAYARYKNINWSSGELNSGNRA